MMLRRTLLLGLACVGLSRGCAETSSSSVSQVPSTDVNDSLPPHCDALSLVWKTQQNQIKELEFKHAKAEHQKEGGLGEPDRWWFDTDERRWTVTRPFPPGGVDSTHWFEVTYLVGSTQTLSWHVDTRKQEVSLTRK